MPKLIHRRIGGWLADLFAVCVAGYFTYVSIEDVMSGGFLSGLLAAFCILFILGLIPLWLQLRFAPSVFRLAQCERRQDIAVTLISAREYMTQGIKLRLVRALLPWFVALIVITSAVIYDSSDSDAIFVIPLLAVSMMLSGISFAAAGLGDLFIRLCRIKGRASFNWAAFLIIWWLGAVGWAVGLTYAVVEFSNENPFAMVIAFTIILLSGLLIARSRCKKAVKACYSFD